MEKYLTPFQDYSTADDSSLLCDISGVTTQTEDDRAVDEDEDAHDDAFEDNAAAAHASVSAIKETSRLVTFDGTADLDEGPLEEEEEDEEGEEEEGEEYEESEVESVVEAQENVPHPEMHLDMLKVRRVVIMVTMQRCEYSTMPHI